MKKVVIINQNAGYLTIDIANALYAKYDEIYLIAGVIKPMERELNPAVKIQKIIRYNRMSTFNRIFTWCLSSIQIFFFLLFKFRQYEVIYTTNPPLACLSSLLLRNKFSIIVYDTYPDTLINIGISKTNILYLYWSKWNQKLFKKAEKIVTLSNGMADQLSNYTERRKITVIPNWSGSDKFAPVKKEENQFILRHSLGNKFIVLYSGNIGYTHSVETVMEVAKLLENEVNICFLIIGEGKKKEKLIRISKELGLHNCLFMSWQPADILPFSLASAGLAIVSLNEEAGTLSVPSKTYNLLTVGAPLLCIAPENSELSLLVEKHQNGVCYSKERVNDISNFILELSKDTKLQKKLSDNSLAASKNYTYAHAKDYI